MVSAVNVICILRSKLAKGFVMFYRAELLFFIRCGGTIGIYFLVKRCSLLYLFANNGTFAQSPYLDAHGEVDISMRYALRIHLPSPSN